MANAMIGNHPSHSYQLVESLDTTGKQLTPADSGKIFMVDQNGTADVDINLPQLSTSIAGWHAKFVLRAAAANDFHLMAYGNVAAGGTTGDNDTIVYLESSTTASTNASADVIQITGGAATVGDWCELFTDGSKWYATSHLSAVGGGAPVDS